MFTMIHLFAVDFLAAASPAANEAATNVKNLTDGIRAFLAPIILLIISVVALSFLLKREMKKAIQFAVIAIFVGVFFYTPNIVENLATMISGLFGGVKA